MTAAEGGSLVAEREVTSDLGTERAASELVGLLLLAS